MPTADYYAASHDNPVCLQVMDKHRIIEIYFFETTVAICLRSGKIVHRLNHDIELTAAC
jgi:hypothetical protein